MSDNGDDNNIFDSLFTYRMGGDRSPNENFLTEAFAYVLRNDDLAFRLWLKGCAEKDIDLVQDPHVETQWYAGTFGFFDLWVEYTVRGQKKQLIVENKWDAPTGKWQLEKYAEFAKKQPCTRLLFVAPGQAKKDIAKKVVGCKAFRWDEFYTVLNGSRNDLKENTVQFLDFICRKGLGPMAPLTEASMVSYLDGNKVIDRCEAIMSQVGGRDWSCVRFPRREGPFIPTNRWGRLALEFPRSQDWNPCVTLGILFDGRDHRVELCDPRRGLDLMLRIEGDRNAELESVRRIFEQKTRDWVEFMKKTKPNSKYSDVYGTKNKRTILLWRECLSDVLGDCANAEDQVDAIYERLKSWCKILFPDGDRSLEDAFEKAFPGTQL
ncbi:hypothetical protein WDW86_19090 [Bdellovibrionota bacterium FG-2]